MKIMKYIMLASVGLMAVACQDKIDNEPKPSGNEGDEVVFGATLDEAVSRTIYGPENVSGKYFPIYWLKTDQMIVASPQGCINRNIADYGVNPDVFTDGATTSQYAGTLVKKGDTGVQWGTSEKADFYSIYPQRTDMAQYKVTTTTGSSFNINVPEMQCCKLGTKSSTDLTPVMTTADMSSCFMYAKTPQVTKGQTVNLRYVPFSTAIRFTLTGPNDNSEVTISKIVLKAPDANPIRGEYTVDLSTITNNYPIVTAGSGAENSVTMYAQYEGEGYLVLKNKQSIELNIFIMLASDKKYDISNGWKLTVAVNGKDQTLSLDGKVPEEVKAKDEEAGPGGNGILTAGKIYRLPTLPPLNASEWKAENWLVNVPRNVYLSEISIPGSWNSLNSDFQTQGSNWSATIDNQYNTGCRAFHIDTRWRGEEKRGMGIIPYCYRYNGHIYDEGGVKSGSDVKNLAVANGSGSWDVRYSRVDLSSQGGEVMNNGAPLFKDVLNTIVGKVQTNEYMVVMCTYAQNSFQHSEDWKDFKSWMQAINDACNTIANTGKIADGRTITKSTTVGDVLGKVIVIVNCEGDVTGISTKSRPTNSKCLFVNAPLTLNSSMFSSTSTGNSGLFYKMEASPAAKDFSLLNIQAQISSSGNSGFNHDKRGYAPALSERQTVGQNILKESLVDYRSRIKSNAAPSRWYYQGIGGYWQSSASGSEGGHTDVASLMNGWISGIIDKMLVTPPSGGFKPDEQIVIGTDNTELFPVGIILMNFVENATYGKPVVKKIWQLNSRYQLRYDPTKEAWPDNTQMTAGGTSVSSGGDGI